MTSSTGPSSLMHPRSSQMPLVHQRLHNSRLCEANTITVARSTKLRTRASALSINARRRPKSSSSTGFRFQTGRDCEAEPQISSPPISSHRHIKIVIKLGELDDFGNRRSISPATAQAEAPACEGYQIRSSRINAEVDIEHGRMRPRVMTCENRLIDSCDRSHQGCLPRHHWRQQRARRSPAVRERDTWRNASTTT